MRQERFFKHHLLPFAEVRYTRSSQASFKQHMHRTFSIGAVDRGAVRYEAGGRSALLEPGSLAIINPEVLHSCNSLRPEGRSYFMLYLETDWCLQVQQSLWNVDAFVAAEKIRVDDRQLYRSYCSTMETMIDETALLQEKEQLLFELACNVFRHCCRPQTERSEPPASIEHLKALLQKDLGRDLPLNAMAEKLGTNPYTLIRRFKTVTGLTPHAYRMNCRIDRAKQYLQEGMDITETALECGFFDQSHFTKFFKAITTVTPNEYRVNFLQYKA